MSSREEDLEDAFHTASREAESAFGNGEVFLEKYLTHVRHVEMQILADQQGNILCLGERDCSLQLNKQKVLEETPSPVMTEDIRRKMMDAAVLAAKAANYTNAGTVEFLLAPDGQFYFIEMNTRLQVEHPITEEISGVDIVWLCTDCKHYKMKKTESDREFDYYTVEMTMGEEPFYYYFEVASGLLHVFFDRYGVSKERRDTYRFCIIPGFSTPEWSKGAVMYQILVDRFYNGDPANDVLTDEYYYIQTPSKKMVGKETDR